jgi:cobaltochelatase CobS
MTNSTATLHTQFGLMKNGQPLAIPVSSLCSMGNGTNVKVNPHFVHSSEYVKKFLVARKLNKNLWVWGSAGTGKTETCEQIAAGLNCPATVISFGEETSLRDLIGGKILSNGETPWQDGALVKAMRTPDMVIALDEVNMANPGVTAMMNHLLQKREIVIAETGEVVKCAEGVMLIATANTAGGSDESGLFAGSQTQNAATRSRFVGLKMTYMDAEHEQQIVLKRVPEFDMVFPPLESIKASSLMVKVGNGLRAAIDDGQLGMAFSVRQLINWAECSVALGSLGEGFKMAYSDMLPDSELMVAEEIFKTTTGMSL